MEHIHNLLRLRFNRFLIIGTCNTAINFAILNLAISGLHLNKVAASILATCCAIVFSFVFNRNFVFRDRSELTKKFARFSIIAAAGTLFIQTSLFTICLHLLRRQGLDDNSVVQINISNFTASMCVMFWNYNGYRLFVFKDKKQRDGLIEETSQEPA